MSAKARLHELGLELPQVVAPLAAYVPAVRTGNLVYTAGQLPFVDGKLTGTGKVGAGVAPMSASRWHAPARSTRWPPSMRWSVSTR